jgi:uncharacterized membrane-anchored protein
MGRAVMSLVATATYDRHGIDVPAVIGSACALCVIASLVAFERNEARSAVQPR